MGSWPFVGSFVLFMLLWVAANSFIRPGQVWDPYPYILLNLFLSMLAGLQGAILLIAAKRQYAIAAAMAQHDLDTDMGSKRDLDLLMEMNRAQLAMIQQLRTELQRLGKPGTGPDTPGR
ncbi:DUF1003 domain-containing protein [Arthrobacter sp. AQ5-05]|nr:DUF1003 domain-containing protein [Arthrobacter sp. AQ5-05]RAX48525.1 DUF1003 domain-containing protein [Arthrobacter sp. AQ5-05]